MERLNINKNKGITLIALVITIIVLLILAGVSIAMITGENGILNQAKKAKEETEIASEEEKVKLATSGALLQDNGESIIQSNLQSELSKYFDTEDFSVSSGTNDEGKNGFIVTITENVKEGRKYFVSQNGKVEKYEEPQVAELTDIYLNLYDDGTLVFSNNSELMEGKTLEKSYGNIKGKTFGVEQTGNMMTIKLPYITIENIIEDSQEEAMNQLMTELSKIKKVVIENKIVPDSTAYWFFNCEPTYGLSLKPNRNTKPIMKAKGSKAKGVCSEERSMISPEYARNFICDFILGKKNENSLLTLF